MEYIFPFISQRRRRREALEALVQREYATTDSSEDRDEAEPDESFADDPQVPLLYEFPDVPGHSISLADMPTIRMFLYQIILHACANNAGLAEHTWLGLLSAHTSADAHLLAQIMQILVPADESWAQRNITAYLPACVPDSLRRAGAKAASSYDPATLPDSDSWSIPVSWATALAKPNPPFRLAALIWLVLTSTRLCASDVHRGLRPRTTNALGDLIRLWYLIVQSFHLAMGQRDTAAIQGFVAAMDNAGHICHFCRLGSTEPMHGLSRWVTMMTRLEGGRVPNITCFGCFGCSASPPSGSSNILLAEDGTECDPQGPTATDPVSNIQHPQIWVALLWIFYLGPSVSDSWHDFIHAAVAPNHLSSHSESLAEFNLTRDSPDTKYLPWLNVYPSSWRSHLSKLSSDDWKRALATITAASRSHPKWRVTQLGLLPNLLSKGLDSLLTVSPRDQLGVFVWLVIRAMPCSPAVTRCAARHRWFQFIYLRYEVLRPLLLTGKPHFSVSPVIDYHAVYRWYQSILPQLSQLLPRACTSELAVALLGCDEYLRCRYCRRFHLWSAFLASTKEPKVCVYEQLWLYVTNLLARQIFLSADHKFVERTIAELQNLYALMQGYDAVECIAASDIFRGHLLAVLSSLKTRNLDNPAFRDLISEDERNLAGILNNMLLDPKGKASILELRGNLAKQLGDVIEYILDRPELVQSLDSEYHKHHLFRRASQAFRHVASRMIVALSLASDSVSSSLLIGGIKLYEQHPIAGGGFADIYLATLNDKPVALKRLRIFKSHHDRLKTNRRFAREAAVWKELNHPHILPFFGIDAATFEPYLCMVSPWMENGDILGYCTNQNIKDITSLLHQIADGLAYLHEEFIVHGDLRGTNILIDDTGCIRLTDFGLAIFDDATQSNPSSSTGHHGSVRWMAPELHFPRDFGLSIFKRTSSTDVYAYACVCLEVYTGKAPFMDITNEAEVLIEISKGLRPSRPSTSVTGRVVAESMWAILDQCWNNHPQSRPEIADILETLVMWNNNK